MNDRSASDHKYNITIPENTRAVMNMLTGAGHEAFLVGGCVRDCLIGRDPTDMDICTDALPEEMLRIFGGAGLDTYDHGAKHGTIGVLIKGEMHEVTTYRVDGRYSDSRHPDSVAFTRNIEEDLSRRDFTINAMAFNEERGLIDPFGGIADLGMRTIRCVGDPYKRFEEDALRIMRAARFCSQLGYDVSADTLHAAEAFRYKLKGISAERIRDEFVKTLIGPSARKALDAFRNVIAVLIPEAEPMFDLDQRNEYHCYDVWSHTLHVVENSSPGSVIRLAAFLHDIGKPPCMTVTESGIGHFYKHEKAGAAIAKDVLTRLKADRKTVETVSELIAGHGIVFQQTEKHARRMLSRFGEEKLMMLIELELADVKSQAPHVREERVRNIGAFRETALSVIEKEQCFSLRDLAADGHDLMAAGIPRGPEIGRILDILLEKVIEGECENDRRTLMEEASKLTTNKLTEK